MYTVAPSAATHQQKNLLTTIPKAVQTCQYIQGGCPRSRVTFSRQAFPGASVARNRRLVLLTTSDSRWGFSLPLLNAIGKMPCHRDPYSSSIQPPCHSRVDLVGGNNAPPSLSGLGGARVGPEVVVERAQGVRLEADNQICFRADVVRASPAAS